MMRFAEVLLLAVFTSFVNGLDAMRSTVKHDALRKAGVIRGLLEGRQSFFFCPGGEFICETEFCCDVGWQCCRDGGCCQPGTFCDVGSNGLIGCCPNGRICTGPGGNPVTVGPPPSTTTFFSTSTSTIHFTATSTSTTTSIPIPAPTSTSTSRSTTTFTTLVGGPTQVVGESIVEVSVLDVNVTWSGNWVQGTSSCDPSVTSKSTTTVGSSFTYITQESEILTYWFNVVNYNTEWEVFVDDILDERYFAMFSSVTNCTYFQSSLPSFASSTLPKNITVVVRGLDNSVIDRTTSWSFEFNKLLIQQEDTSSTSTTFGGFGFGTQTPGPLPTIAASASERSQPYRPLLVSAGIFLALIYCA